MSASCPFWLEVNADKTGFNVLEDKADIVRLIYKMKASGSGYMAIAAHLNEQGYPTPTGRGTAWQVSYIKKVITKDMAYGVLVSRHGDRWPEYYPKVLDEETYQQVRALREQSGGKGLVPGKHWVLSGLIKHQCGQTVVRVNQGTGYIRLKCPACRTLAKIGSVEALVSAALFNLQYVASPTDMGEKRLGLEQDLMALGLEIEDAWTVWRKTKALEAKETYERLLSEQIALKASIVEATQSNTEVLSTLEERALIGAGSKGLLSVVRQVAKSLVLNHTMDAITLTSISGRVVTLEEPKSEAV
jgi:hypothetical protein